MSIENREASQPAPDQQPSVSDMDLRPTAMERLLDSDSFQRSLDSRIIPLRVAATGVVIVYALSQGLRHPEYLDQL